MKALARRILRHAFPLIVLLTFLGLLAARTSRVGTTFDRMADCQGCFNADVVAADAWIAALLLGLMAGSLLARSRTMGLAWRLAALALLGFYALDVYVFGAFTTRLNVHDMAIYGAQMSLLGDHVSGTAQPAAIVAVCLMLVILLVSLGPSPARHPRLAAVAALACAGSCALGMAGGSDTSYVHDWAVRNVLAANAWTGEAVAYSQTTVDDILGSPPEITCLPGQGRADDVIMVILESWSPYQSRLWSGLNDWTPRLDTIAAGNTWYPDLMAGGFTTNEGLISLLGGMEFLSPVKPFFQLSMSFETAWDIPDSLPRLLRQAGYHTAFLTSGDLSFSRKGEWLENLGFEHREGHDHPDYDGLPRRHFRSVADEVLYQRSLDYLDAHAGPKPLLLVIETVSSHQPFMHPITKERNLEQVIRYVDAATGDFHDALAARGFFDHGLLIVVSDHRSMTPVSVAEQQLAGRAAASWVPMIVAGAGLSGRVVTPLHQSDLAPALARRTSEQWCTARPGPSPFLLNEGLERCRFHARGDRRDHIDVFCPGGDGTVQLGGDASAFIDVNGLSREEQDHALAEIARYRLGASARQRQFERRLENEG